MLRDELFDAVHSEEYTANAAGIFGFFIHSRLMHIIYQFGSYCCQQIASRHQRMIAMGDTLPLSSRDPAMPIILL